MNNKCKCGHEEENHYLGTEGCAICYKVDKFLCTKYEPMNETKTESWEDRFDKESVDIFIGFSEDGEFNRYLNELDDKAIIWIKDFIRSEISKAEQRGYNKGFDKGFVEGLTKLDRKGDE